MYLREMTGGEWEKSQERREQREGKDLHKERVDWTFPMREESFLHLVLKFYSGLTGMLVLLPEGPHNQVYI